MEIVRDDVGDLKSVLDAVEVGKKEPIKYDPSKEYGWKETDVFYFSGKEFGAVLHAFRAALNTKEAQTILMIEKASHFVQDAFERSVEAGISKVKEK